MALTRREFLRGAASIALASAAQTVGLGIPPAARAAASGLVAVGQGTDVEAWNPYAHSSTPSYNVWGHIFNQLVAFDWDRKAFVGELAEAWEVKDPLTWVFHLRRGVRFHDGSPFTSADVLYSFNRIRTDKHSLQGPQFRDVDRMEASDAGTFIIRTKAPFSPLLGHLANRVILSKTVADRTPNQDEMDHHPIGTGPYKFVSWERGQQFVLTRNDDYWGSRPLIKDGAFKPIPEDQARLTALLTGAIQVMTNLPPQDVNVVKATKGLHAAGVKSGRIMFIGLQPGAPPLASKAVRQAINYAVNVDAIVRFVLGGHAYRINQPLSDSFFGYDPSYKGYAHDPKKAKALLQEAGYPNGFDIALHSPDGRYTKDKEVAQAIAGQLGEIGIRCSVETAEWGTFSANFTSGRYPMFLIGRGGITDPDDYLTQYFQTGNTKRLGYSNPQVDALFKEEQATFDHEKRVAILRRIARLVMDDAPIIPLFVYQDNYGLSDRIQWQPKPDEYVRLWLMKWR